MDQSIQDKVSVWLSGNYDQATKDAITALQPDELADSFYRNLDDSLQLRRKLKRVRFS